MSLFDPEFPGLLADISEIYTGEKLFWLRLLLYDHCSGSLLSRRNVTGHDLFNELKTRGYIWYEPNDASCTDVEILVVIAEVTEETRALQIIRKFKQKHKNNYKNCYFTKGKPISEYRKNLFKALRSNTTDLLATMPGHYGLNPADFKNKWDLVFKLEGNNDVEEGDIEKMKHFAKILDEDAKDIFLQTQDASASKGTRKRQLTTSEEADNDDSGPSTSNQKRTRESTRKEKPEKLKTKQKKQIVISYSHNQRGTVGLIDNSLKKRLKDTHTICIDVRNMSGGMSQTLDKAISGSSIVLVCTSKDYEESEYCELECDRVLEHHKQLIPLKMESYEPKKDSLIQFIAAKFYIDFSKTIRYEDNINTLIRNIEELENDQM